mmetsp:Transcript_20710/g.49059  ORF Transcript_20710/g.49059 Transcript_20710/m.49059 type:complete len:426 (-) Transcript_20710:247-1524(-)
MLRAFRMPGSSWRAVPRLGYRAMSVSWKAVPMGPADPILGLVEAFNKDTNPKKASLSVGAYRDGDGKPWVLPSVKEAERRVVEANLNKEYAGITGLAKYAKLAIKFALGADSPALQEARVASVQTLSGTGACRVIGEFYSRFLGKGAPIYLPTPTWGNHIPIMRDAGLDVRSYRYFDKATNGLDYEGMMEDLAAMPDGAAVMLHACAHNPTGIDPTPAQWKEISKAIKAKQHHVLMDSAYQGFASGDAERDAFSVRQFVRDGHSFALAQSFAKNFGLYGERVGLLSMVCGSPEEAERLESQLKLVIRPMYSNPPIHGARIVEEVLGDPKLEAQWRAECSQMAERIIAMRAALSKALTAAGSTRDWSHVTSQIGMFCFSGMSKEQVDQLRAEHSIYLTGDGRISMAGITQHNVDYIAKAIHSVTSK